MAHLLPANIVFEVLLRLGVRDLSRFRCVCKLWYDLISDPYFLKLHSLRPEQSPRLLLHSSSYDCNELFDGSTIRLHSVNIKDGVVQWQTKKEIFSFYAPRSDASFSILCSTNLNLICICGTNHIYLCNPTTKALVTLPMPKPPVPKKMYFNTFGFGYYDIASAKKYKVVRFSYDYLSGADQRCEVFDLGSDHWRQVEDPPSPLINVDAPFVNGAIYCITDLQVMVSFDIKTEKFQELPLPKGIEEGILDRQNPHLRTKPHYLNARINLMELDGLLCVSDMSSYISGQRDCGMDLWLLKDNCNAVWVKQYNIDLNCLGDIAIGMLHPIIVEGTRILMLLCRKLVYYDLQIKSFSEVHDEAEGFLECGLQGLWNCGLYVENLSFSRGDTNLPSQPLLHLDGPPRAGAV